MNLISRNFGVDSPSQILLQLSTDTDMLGLIITAAEMIMDGSTLCLNCCTSCGIIATDLEQENQRRTQGEKQRKYRAFFGQGKQDNLFPFIYFSFSFNYTCFLIFYFKRYNRSITLIRKTEASVFFLFWKNTKNTQSIKSKEQ